MDAVHFEFVLFGLAAEHGMVVQDQDRRVRSVLVVAVGGSEAGEAAADYNQIIDFA